MRSAGKEIVMFWNFVERVVCVIGVLLFGWLGILIAFLVLIDSKGRIFFTDIRLGKNEQPITVLKFRTMHNNVSDEDQQLLKRSREWQEYRKCHHDPRITKIGKYLRKFSLDELPQIFNVIYGNMSLVGPRPISAEENKLYGKYAKLIHSVKPGITGLWQVSGRNLLTYRRRVAINVYYVKNKSLKLDLWILYKTIGAVISGRGAW